MEDVKIYAEKEQAVYITAMFKDFEGDTRAWQEAYFQLLSWKNTFSFCYELDISATYEHEAFVRVVAKAGIKKQLAEYMQGMGYRRLSIEDIWIGVGDIESDDEDIYEWYLA